MSQSNYKEDGEKWLEANGFVWAAVAWVHHDSGGDVSVTFRDGYWHAVVARWLRRHRDVREALALASRAAKDSVLWTRTSVATAEMLLNAGKSGNVSEQS